MPDLKELYQELVVDHSQRPRNSGKIQNANRQSEGFNPLCGDRVALYIEIEGGIIKDLSFEGTGCAISIASSSLMTEVLKGKTVQQALRLFEVFHQLVTTDPARNQTDLVDLGKLEVFKNLRDFPMRVKCATLAWHTLRGALNQEENLVSTEG